MSTVVQTVDLSTLDIRPLDDPSVFDGFCCGEDEVDRNLLKCFNWHDQYRRRVYCGYIGNPEVLCGFYCLGVSASESRYLDIPIWKKILRLDNEGSYTPFIYLNYLGVKEEYQRSGIGTLLLMHALERGAGVARSIGICGMSLHALNDHSASLYDNYGFRALDEKMEYPFMILPTQTLLDLFPG